MPSMSVLPDFTDGVLVDAGQLNTVATNVDTLAQLTLGRTLASGASTKPIVHLTSSTSRTYASSTATPQVITWDTEDVDTDNMAAAGGTTITINTAGWWEFCLQVTFPSAAAGRRSALLLVNGTANPTNVAAQQDEFMGDAKHMQVQVHLYDRFTAGTVIRAALLQDTGGSLAGEAFGGGIWLAGAWDAPYS